MVLKRALVIINLLILLFNFPMQIYAADDKYIWEKPIVKNIGWQADKLKAELINEVQKIVDAGHLEPAFYIAGITPGLLFWGYPGEQVYILSQALPYLPANLQNQVKSFLQTENQGYPPESVGFIHNNNSGWGSDLLDGNRREFYSMDSDISVNIWPPVEVPLEGLFMLWKYADQTGDWQYISNNWNEIVNLYNKKSGSVDSYGGIAGLIGMARIAEHLGNNGIKNDAVIKANSALDNSNYLNYINNAEAKFENMMHDWDYPVFCFTRQPNAIGCFFSPEIGRFLHDNHFHDVHQSVDFYIGSAADSYPDSLLPAWFIYRGEYDYHEWRLGNHINYNSKREYLGGENPFRPPDIAWVFFMVRAYIFQDEAPILEKFIDIPSCIGDLYHIQKLVAVIEAYGQTCWEDVRTGVQDCEPAPSEVPTPTPNSPLDILKILVNWGYGGDSEVDFNTDGKVNGVDFGWAAKDLAR